MKLRTAGWLGLATLLPACIYTNSWSYSPAPRRPGPPLLDRTLVVLPLEDQRGTEVSLGGGLALIPFFIYGTNSWQRFEQGPAGGGGGSHSRSRSPRRSTTLACSVKPSWAPVAARRTTRSRAASSMPGSRCAA